MNDVTLILQQIQEGRAEAGADLFPAVYEELRRLAGSKMRAERLDHTLSATALVHEAYVRLVDNETAKNWESRGQFLGVAAEAMRRILVEHARQKMAIKRGGDKQRYSDCDLLFSLPTDPAILLDLNEAIESLTINDPQSAELLKLLLFTGISVVEAGRILEMSRKTAYRHWDYIRSWFAVHYSSN
ncbi:ECF-type sigma factor [Bythopirellula polymerisocia]|uniref:ECF sigma factor n=1 Tax=Bythopirellula polymerisocia TaxID=2528003 RepID=A0A5C6CYA0_9BACT|nr:ECF-type sigma factor [Bythopirellula polymerisocia]TWU27619.1 ECF sigma factor [Bythopirellula polymerisocia]